MKSSGFYLVQICGITKVLFSDFDSFTFIYSYAVIFNSSLVVGYC